MKISLPVDFEVAKNLSGNQAIDVIAKARAAYGNDWSVTFSQGSVFIRHVATYARAMENEQLFVIETVKKVKAK